MLLLIEGKYYIVLGHQAIYLGTEIMNDELQYRFRRVDKLAIYCVTENRLEEEVQELGNCCQRKKDG